MPAGRLDEMPMEGPFQPDAFYDSMILPCCCAALSCDRAQLCRASRLGTLDQSFEEQSWGWAAHSSVGFLFRFTFEDVPGLEGNSSMQELSLSDFLLRRGPRAS